MFRNITILIILLVSCWSLTSAQEGGGEGLKVHVEGIRNHPGEIGVAIYNNNTGYPLHLEHAYEVEWRKLEKNQETADVVFDSIPSGKYAVSILHDENGNRIVDRNSQAFPQEGVGFSNDHRITFRSPHFNESKFSFFADKIKEIVIRLDYEAGQKTDDHKETAPKVLPGRNEDGLAVRVEGIRNDKGELGVAVFNNKIGYPTDLKYVYDGQWIKLQPNEEVIEVAFDSLPEGEFAISVFHDENGNRKLERNFMGFPQEGVAFSNDQKVVLSAPTFEKSKFPISQGENKRITVLLDYRIHEKEDENNTPVKLLEKPEVSPKEMAEGLVIRVEGIRNNQGQMGIALFNEKKAYLMHLQRAYELKWISLEDNKDTFQVIFDSIPAGEYAVVVFHDENGNSKLEQNNQGFPKEGVGFSNNRKLGVGAPDFERCKVALLPGENKTILIKLDYKEKIIH